MGRTAASLATLMMRSEQTLRCHLSAAETDPTEPLEADEIEYIAFISTPQV
jgi:hypothetical protein